MQPTCLPSLLPNHSSGSFCHSSLVPCHHCCTDVATWMWQILTLMQSTFGRLTEAAVKSHCTLSQSSSHHEAFPALTFKHIQYTFGEFKVRIVTLWSRKRQTESQGKDRVDWKFRKESSFLQSNTLLRWTTNHKASYEIFCMWINSGQMTIWLICLRQWILLSYPCLLKW